MSKTKITMAGLLALACCFGSAQAGIDLNEVGAFLVYPGVEASRGHQYGNDETEGAEHYRPTVETFLTITNTSTQSLIAHVSFIDGESCFECDWDVPMSGLDTETLVVTREYYGVTNIVNLDTGASRTCHQKYGFVTVDVEDFDHNVLTDNILLGSQVVVNYSSGAAISVPAISIQGDSGSFDRWFAFDGIEYRKFPSVVGADFIAPDYYDGIDATLILFTLAFERQFPPFTDCSVIGFDAFESQFSNSFQFGCWTAVDLEDIDPEFAYPYLGDAFDYQEHGWLQLNCTVFGTGNNGVVQGGVHGAIAQYVPGGSVVRVGGPSLYGAAAWARLLYQSGTVGDALTLHLEAPATGGQF